MSSVSIHHYLGSFNMRLQCLVPQLIAHCCTAVSGLSAKLLDSDGGFVYNCGASVGWQTFKLGVLQCIDPICLVPVLILA